MTTGILSIGLPDSRRLTVLADYASFAVNALLLNPTIGPNTTRRQRI